MFLVVIVGNGIRWVTQPRRRHDKAMKTHHIEQSVLVTQLMRLVPENLNTHTQNGLESKHGSSLERFWYLDVQVDCLEQLDDSLELTNLALTFEYVSALDNLFKIERV